MAHSFQWCTSRGEVAVIILYADFTARNQDLPQFAACSQGILTVKFLITLDICLFFSSAVNYANDAESAVFIGMV